MSTEMSTIMSSSNGERLCKGPTVDKVDIKEEVPDDESSNECSLEDNKEIKKEDIDDELLDPKTETNGNFHVKKEEVVKNEDEDESSLDIDDDEEEEDEEEFSDSDDDDEERDHILSFDRYQFKNPVINSQLSK